MSDFYMLAGTLIFAGLIFALASWKYDQDETLYNRPRQRFHINLD